MSRSPLVRLLAVTVVLAASARNAESQAFLGASLEARGPMLERAWKGAMLRLEQPECLRVLRDFKDDRGRLLEERLAFHQRSAAEYLAGTPFRDGAFNRYCRGGKSALVSVVGMRQVLVCPTFHELAERDPEAAEIWLIHELLHTLGLGENPPSSREITKRVGERCRQVGGGSSR